MSLANRHNRGMILVVAIPMAAILVGCVWQIAGLSDAVSFREKPFHGVRALRMKPVGSGKMYGRDGILAHSYLLGEAGASNGCISVRDYDKFLQAFEAGKFNQVIVVRSVDEPSPAPRDRSAW